MDMLDQFVTSLLDGLARLVRSNALFAVAIAAVIALLIAGAWWSLSN